MINETLVMEDSDYCFLAPRSHGEFSQIGEKSYMTKTLLEEAGMVGVRRFAVVLCCVINLCPKYRFLMLHNSH